jgi:hypothetical protein
MKLDFAVLAEAVGSSGGKLFIHGAPIKRIDVPTLPWAVSIGVALSFTGTLDEAGSVKQLEMKIYGPDNDRQVLATPSMSVALPMTPPPDWERLAAIVTIELGVIGLTHDGWHRVQFLLDGDLVKELEFRVVVTPRESPVRIESREGLDSQL